MTQAGTSAGPLTIETTRGHSESVVTLKGRVVIDTSPHVRTVLLGLIRERVSPLLVIETSDVTYLDTSGIATLLDASRRARAQSVRLRVVGLTGAPRMLAQMIEIDRIFAALGSAAEVR